MNFIGELPVFAHVMATPIGELYVEASERGVCKALFVDKMSDKPNAELCEDPSVCRHLDEAVMQLDEYFNGKRKEFDLQLDMIGTDFQKQIWQALSDIPYGEHCSYGDLAKAIGNPKSVRAVGAANGRNPVSIIVPCHRVIGKNGALTGYAGGLARKQWLLNLEAPAMASLDLELA